MRKRVALLGFLAPLMVGTLPGSAEAQWGGVGVAWYRPWYPSYPRYYRPYSYPRVYGGCGCCCCGCGGYGYGGYGYGGYGYGGYGNGGYGNGGYYGW